MIWGKEVRAVDNVTVTAVISIVATISGIYLGWTGHSRTLAKDYRSEGGAQAKLQSDVEYIKRGVDDLRLEVKDQGRRFDELAERVTRVEESAKQAHKRIDRIERNPPAEGLGT